MAEALSIVVSGDAIPEIDLETVLDEFVDVARHWIDQGVDFESLESTRAVCGYALRLFWSQRAKVEDLKAWCGADMPFEIRSRAGKVARLLTDTSLLEAFYFLSTLYTRLLPSELRSKKGAFYTPPALAERLLDLAASEGADWASASVLDPACGGGAFLLPVTNRILGDHRIQNLGALDRLKHLERNLCGVEIDEFAAWMTRCFLRLQVRDLVDETGYEPKFEIKERDAIRFALESDRKFDLVIGNPPFRKIKLDEGLRSAYQRSLFGHANTYGLFLDAALRWRSKSGLVAFLTPTSFIGGQYFSRLREVILEQAPPLVIDVVQERKGVFPSVLQETCLAVFGPNDQRTTVVNLLSAAGKGVTTRRAATLQVGGGPVGAPWILPRSSEQAALVRAAQGSRTRLHDLGYRASTGPLVWNRHRDQLRKAKGEDTYPLIWAEAVRSNRFSFEYKERSHSAFCSLREGQDHLLTKTPCVLVQRTTAKEQARRLVACPVPRDFVRKWDGIVVENHVNVLKPLGKDAASARSVAAVLNTEAVDLLFRAISGSVAVSVTELHAIPLPSRSLLAEVDELLDEGSICSQKAAEIERLVARWYETQGRREL